MALFYLNKQALPEGRALFLMGIVSQDKNKLSNE